VSGGRLRTVADDLTGACDVAAALRPMSNGIVVEGPARWARPGSDRFAAATIVRNTQSRTLPPSEAAGRVRAALADVPAAWRGILLKKIDTGLRGPLGAELDAAMDAIGAEVAVVLAALPEAGRATVGGMQLVDGVPVHETAFARDPHNPVSDARIGAVIEATSRRRTANVGTDEMRRRGAAAAIARHRAARATVIVGDATTDDDLVAWVDGLELDGAAPVVIVGSTGVARALRRRLPDADATPAAPTIWPANDRPAGVLVVAGSAHEVTHEQLAHAARTGALRVVTVDRGSAVASGAAAAADLRAGRDVALCVPRASTEGSLDALGTATTAALEARPAAVVLVGGETAHHVMALLGHPRLWVESIPAPLAVRTSVIDGPLGGLPVVTKGGSSGPPTRLVELIEEVRR
jgi:uncharacterized protein YgbK (DUF1537 family)